MRTTMTAIEVAEYIGVCIDTVYSMVREKQIPHIKVRRRIFFRKDTIDAWMANQEKSNIA